MRLILIQFLLTSCLLFGCTKEFGVGKFQPKFGGPVEDYQRPSSQPISGQQRELFPFDAFNYTRPTNGNDGILRMKKGWSLQAEGTINVFDDLILSYAGDDPELPEVGDSRIRANSGGVYFEVYGGEPPSWVVKAQLGGPTEENVPNPNLKGYGLVHPDSDEVLDSTKFYLPPGVDFSTLIGSGGTVPFFYNSSIYENSYWYLVPTEGVFSTESGYYGIAASTSDFDDWFENVTLSFWWKKSVGGTTPVGWKTLFRQYRKALYGGKVPGFDLGVSDLGSWTGGPGFPEDPIAVVTETTTGYAIYFLWFEATIYRITRLTYDEDFVFLAQTHMTSFAPWGTYASIWSALYSEATSDSIFVSVVGGGSQLGDITTIVRDGVYGSTAPQDTVIAHEGGATPLGDPDGFLWVTFSTQGGDAGGVFLNSYETRTSYFFIDVAWGEIEEVVGDDNDFHHIGIVVKDITLGLAEGAFEPIPSSIGILLDGVPYEDGSIPSGIYRYQDSSVAQIFPGFDYTWEGPPQETTTGRVYPVPYSVDATYPALMDDYLFYGGVFPATLDYLSDYYESGKPWNLIFSEDDLIFQPNSPNGRVIIFGDAQSLDGAVTIVGKTGPRGYQGEQGEPGQLEVSLDMVLDPQSRALIWNVTYPIGSYYTQYPAVDDVDPAIKFPVNESPASMFGGSWEEQTLYNAGGAIKVWKRTASADVIYGGIIYGGGNYGG